MSTPLVVSLTDELTEELEFDLEVAETTHQLEASVSRDALAALLAERAELIRDAWRYRWLRQSMWYVGPDNFFCGEGGDMNDYENHNYLATNLDAAIDAAMQSEAKP